MPKPVFDEALRTAAREFSREGMPASIDRRLRRRLLEKGAKPRRHRGALVLGGLAAVAAAVTLWLLTAQSAPRRRAPAAASTPPTAASAPLPGEPRVAQPAQVEPAPIEPAPVEARAPEPQRTPSTLDTVNAPAPSDERPPRARTRAPEPKPASPPNASGPAVPTASAGGGADPLMRELAEQRARGQWREAADTMTLALNRLELGDPGREVLLFELATIVAEHLGNADRACAAFSDYAREYAHGRYAADVARARIRLDCPTTR